MALPLQRAIPEDVGVSSRQLASFVNRFFSLKWTHGLVVLRHGRIVAEAYRSPCSPADRHQLFSLSKSFTSTALGIALGEGRIKSIDAPILPFFPEYDSARITPRMRRVTLRHLLTMSMGRASCGLWGDRYAALADAFRDSADAADMGAVARRFAVGDENFGNGEPWVKNLLEDELADEPGTVFTYNSAATFLISAVLQKVTGMTLTEYLRPRLFAPLGFSGDLVWDTTPDGIDRGGTGLNLTVREIAAAGQFWLRGGILQDGRRIVPENYFKAATTRQIENDGPGRSKDWCQGYGFQFWQCQHGAFRGDGASGQLAVMLPGLDAVVAATAGLRDMQKELDAIWDGLLPAFSGSAIAHDNAGVAALREAENSQRFEFGPDGAVSDALPMGECVAFGAGANPYGITSVSFEQDAFGVSADVAFGDGFVDRIRAGWTCPASAVLGRLMRGHSFEVFSKAHWSSPGVLKVTMAVTRTTQFFEITVDFNERVVHCHTDIWFAHPWLADCKIELAGNPASSNQ